MDRRMPSGCIPKARFCSSGSAEWVIEKGCSMSGFLMVVALFLCHE